MKLLILFRPDSEHESEVRSFARDLQREHDLDESKLELVSVNTRDGSATASLYDIMTYPSVLALANDGSVVNIWQGLPLMDEIMAYMYR